MSNKKLNKQLRNEMIKDMLNIQMYLILLTITFPVFIILHIDKFKLLESSKPLLEYIFLNFMATNLGILIVYCLYVYIVYVIYLFSILKGDK